MSFYKKCYCGEIIFGETRREIPDFCPKCKRDIMDILIQDDSEEIPEKPADDIGDLGCEESGTYETGKTSAIKNYFICFPTGEVIKIPKDGFELGRQADCSAILKDYCSVSRHHLIIKPCDNGVGLSVEDVSTYGSYINGKKLNKNIPKTIIPSPETTITLCNINIIIREDSTDETC